MLISKEVLKQKQISKLSNILHEKWRQDRKNSNGLYEPRVEPTSDQAWIKLNQKEKVDLANTDYDDLPTDWQHENKLSAEVAINEIYKAQELGIELDNSFVEKSSELIHQKWLERNGNSKFLYQDLPYSELSEEEKEKDRDVIRGAIAVINEI